MDIPEDMMKAAIDVALLLPATAKLTEVHAFRDAIARALLAQDKAATERERARCAKVARKDCRTALAIEHDYKPTWYVRAEQIAAEIESGSQP